MKKFIYILALFMLSGNLYSDWVKIASFPNVPVNDIWITGNTLYASSINSGIYKSTNGTASWQQLNNGLNNPEAIQCHQVIQTGNILFAATVDGIYKSTDFAASWVRKSYGILLGNGALNLFAESVFELNGTLFTGAYSGIYRSTNGGDNWVPTNISGMHILAKNFTVHNGIIFSARESINNPVGYKSTDNGLTWLTLSPFQYPTISFLSEGAKLFTGTIHGAWLSTNDGLNWVQRSQGLSPDPYNSSFVRANGFLVTSLKFGGSGMYKSTNDGVLWEGFAQGLPFLQAINEIMILNGKILAATSVGIYERNVSELTGISQISGEVPEKFSLSQNYPNPFNPTTKIKFSIPAIERGLKPLFAKLVVYDLLGKEVRILVNENLQAGIYEADFDASGLSSGIFFYTLLSGDFKETRKCLIIR